MLNIVNVCVLFLLETSKMNMSDNFEVNFAPMKNTRKMWKYSTHRHTKFCTLVRKLNIKIEKGVGLKWDVVYSDIVYTINSDHIDAKWKSQLREYIVYLMKDDQHFGFYVDNNGYLQKN